MTVTAVAIFVLGSGISGGSTNEKHVDCRPYCQGIGGGGLNVMVDLIICDLVPIAERPKFMGFVSAVFAIGTSIGPFVGGSLVQHSS